MLRSAVGSGFNIPSLGVGGSNPPGRAIHKNSLKSNDCINCKLTLALCMTRELQERAGNMLDAAQLAVQILYTLTIFSFL